MVLIFVRSFGFFFLDTVYLTKGLYFYSDGKNNMEWQANKQIKKKIFRQNR